MTAESFERLLYTDCRAGQGRGAGGGFQIQAQSPGVDVVQARMAVGWLLYEVQNAWIAERRPVSEFPLGLAHACADGYGTAQGRYVGQEATGGRQGNHLADCILTRNPDLYGSIRPAQLWRSELWREEPWPDPDCLPLEDEPPLGPLTVDAIGAWSAARPERAPVLERLLSVLEEPAGSRVVIVAGGADEAVSWIAAVTLLLPVRAALEISFKVFCINQQRAAQRIVAVPRELNPQVFPDGSGSAFILDADRCVSDDVPVSDRARFLVGLLANGEDPYDVVDAVELAETLNAGEKLGGADTIATAWALTQPSASLPDHAPLVRWLSAVDPQVRREHGEPVARRLLDSHPTAEVLSFLDAQAADGRIGLRPAEVRGRLLIAEIAQVRADGQVPRQPLVPVTLDAVAWRDAESELTSALLVSAGPLVDRLLRLALRHHVTPELGVLSDHLSQFVQHWFDDAADYDPRHWALGSVVLDLARDQLRFRLNEGHDEAVLGQVWRLRHYLEPGPVERSDEEPDLLEYYIRAAAGASAPDQERPAAIQTLLTEIGARLGSVQTGLQVQRALLAWGVLEPADAVAILASGLTSAAIEPRIVEIATAELDRWAQQPDDDLMTLLADMERRRLVPATDRLTALRRGEATMAELTTVIRDGRLAQGARASGRLRKLGQVSSGILQLRMPGLIAACLDADRVDLAPILLRVVPRARRLIMLKAWARELRGQHPVGGAVWGMAWIMDIELSGNQREQMAKVIRDYGAGLGRAERDQWFADVQEQLSAELAGEWVRFSGIQPPRLLRGLLFRDRDSR